MPTHVPRFQCFCFQTLTLGSSSFFRAQIGLPLTSTHGSTRSKFTPPFPRPCFPIVLRAFIYHQTKFELFFLGVQNASDFYRKWMGSNASGKWQKQENFIDPKRRPGSGWHGDLRAHWRPPSIFSAVLGRYTSVSSVS